MCRICYDEDCKINICEWISIKDRLPEKSGTYLIAECIEGEWIVLACGYTTRIFMLDKRLVWINKQCCGEDEIWNPSHWVELPNPPKKEKQ